MKRYTPPSSPEQMLQQLQAIFPAFEHSWEEDDALPGVSRTFHGLVRELADYFPVNAPSFTDKQVRAFADWINGSVLEAGDIENAVSTCFLEHARQLTVYKLLSPYLSRTAKDRTHA